MSPDVQATRPPVVTAIHRPRIDGVLYGHTGQALPDGDLRFVAGGRPISGESPGRSLDVRWTATDEQGQAAATDAGRRFTHRFREPGEYAVRVEAVDPGTGLTATDSIDVLVRPPPLPDADSVAALEDARNTEPPAPTPTLRFEPTDAQVAPERNATVDVVVAGSAGRDKARWRPTDRV